MIKVVEHINQPISGKYEEKVYGIQSVWNSPNWTWLKFTTDDYSEWCGEFRGKYIGHAISNKYKSILVLTSDYFYQLSMIDGELQHYEDKPEYINLTVTPEGEYIVSDYSGIYLINETIKDVTPIVLPLNLDMIIFKGWKDSKLGIDADEFMNWDNHIKLELDSNLMQIKVVNQSKVKR